MFRNFLALLLITTVVAKTKSHSKYITRIVGGERTSITQFPYVVVIIFSKRIDSSDDCFCGGSIVSPSWVLTAAHCLFTTSSTLRKPYEISIIAGSTNCYNFTSEKRQIVPIARYRVHPAYDARNKRSINEDVAVIMLYVDLVYSASVQPAKLLQTEVLRGKEPYQFFRKRCVSMGWGVQKYGVRDSFAELYSVDLPLISTGNCSKIYEGTLSFNVRNVVCTLLEGRDSCTGDSGGPLICSGGFQLGIVSAGIGCGTEFYPNVWTRVDRYYDWIQGSTDPKVGAFAILGAEAGGRVVRQEVIVSVMSIVCFTYKYI